MTNEKVFQMKLKKIYPHSEMPLLPTQTGS